MDRFGLFFEITKATGPNVNNKQLNVDLQLIKTTCLSLNEQQSNTRLI